MALKKTRLNVRSWLFKNTQKKVYDRPDYTSKGQGPKQQMSRAGNSKGREWRKYSAIRCYY